MSERCRIIEADVLKWAEEYDGAPFHALLCDPPYHLTSITKRFGKSGSAPAKDRDGAFQRQSRGFMGQQWDGGDIAFQPETWAALGKHLHPGAFIMAFAGTRGYHRMACAIEDAGFVIHPLIVYCFGSGFPKATRIDTQIDAEAGAEREVVGTARRGPDGVAYDAVKRSGALAGEFPITEPATLAAQVWQGHRYGLQALKPSLECICVAQKPYDGKPVDSIAATGAGAINIDAGRVGSAGGTAGAGPGPKGLIYGGSLNGAFGKPVHGLGRWPANLCLDEAAAAVLDRQSGDCEGGRPVTGQPTRFMQGGNEIGPRHFAGYSDSGGASRFFHVSNWLEEEHDPFFYTAKAGRVERDAGLEGREKKPLLWSSGEQSPGTFQAEGTDRSARNPHPCVKPLRLTRWLATLLLPPAEYAPRRILVPFAGSGSEAIGAALAGWEEVTAIEMSEEYAEIARARVRFWSGNVGLFESLTAAEEERDLQEAMEL